MTEAELGESWRPCIVKVHARHGFAGRVNTRTLRAFVNTAAPYVAVVFEGGMRLFHLATGASVSAVYRHWTLDATDRATLAQLQKGMS